MKLTRLDLIAALANRLMAQFGVADRFEFSFIDLADHCGLCVDPWEGRPGKIHLSTAFVQLNSLEAVEETLRHEIAHAIAGCAKGHGPAWKKACRLTGAKPLAYAYDVKMPA